MGGVKLYLLLFLAVLVSGLAALLPLAWSGAEALSSSYRENAAREMESNARLFSLVVARDNAGKRPARPGELARSARDASGARYTLIAKDGTVLADSDEDADRMENHLARPEIKTALAGGVGMDVRTSPTLGTEWIYAAVALPDGNLVRAAASMEDLNRRLDQWWKRVLATCSVSFAILLAMALLAARWLSKPLEVAAAGAERYARGDFSYRPPLSGSAEMRRLSGAMAVMAGELDARFRLIKRQHGEMQAVFENMAEGIVAVDTSGKVMLTNGAAEKLLGVPRSLSGRGIASVSRNAGLLDIMRQTAADLPLEREIPMPNHAGGELLLQVRAVRIMEEGKDRGVLAVMRDVTRLRQLEGMRRDFVANVSHELRTPITTIQGCLEALIDSPPDDLEARDKFLGMALRNVQRMGAIFDNLLFLAGMESGQVKNSGKPAVSPLAPVIDEAVSLCRAGAAEREVALSVDCPPDLTARMNPQLLVHALVNLLDNAINYGPAGGTVAVVADQAGDRTRVVVSDRGPGIAPRFQPRIFERFYRIDGASRVNKGSGLGLAIVKHIALSQGGDIQLESELGKGSDFILTIPAK